MQKKAGITPAPISGFFLPPQPEDEIITPRPKPRSEDPHHSILHQRLGDVLPSLRKSIKADELCSIAVARQGLKALVATDSDFHCEIGIQVCDDDIKCIINNLILQLHHLLEEALQPLLQVVILRNAILVCIAYFEGILPFGSF